MKRSMGNGLWVAVVLGAGLMWSTPATAQKADARQRTLDLIEALKAVKVAPEEGSLSKSDRAANKTAFTKLDGYFDFNRLVETPIKRHRSKFSKTDYDKFLSRFRALIRLISYPQAGSFLRTAEVQVQKATQKKNQAVVPMAVEVPEEDLEMEVTFHWAPAGKSWKLVDVAFDGASLLKDYENQFGRIIAKDGVSGLMGKIDKRYAQEKQASIVDL